MTIHNINIIELMEGLLLNLKKGNKHVDITCINTIDMPNTILLKSNTDQQDTDTEPPTISVA